MSRLVFVTTELHPETGGGAGVLIDDLSQLLARQREVVIVLLTTSRVKVQDRPGIAVLNKLFSGSFLERSKTAASALAEVVQPEDRIEFQDFEGLGFWALANRQELALTANPITVRFHGPYDLISDKLAVVPDDWAIPRAMEAEVFRMADRVVVPVEGHIPNLERRYGLREERIDIGPPPVNAWPAVDQRDPSAATFAVIGRLGEVKGSEEMVAAAVSLLEAGKKFLVRFIGADGWSAKESLPMSQVLQSMIPKSLHDNFEFVGHLAKEDLSSHLEDVGAIVVPSRFESFCLTAHEARRAGFPVLVPDIDAFRDLFTADTGALVYEAGSQGLTNAMSKFLEDEGLAGRLASSPAPSPGDPLTVYESDPAPRHVRSQAGLATAATQRLEQAAQSSQPRESKLQGLFRFVPGFIATAARRALPRMVKDRFRDVASWPVEQARRARADRLESVARAIEDGRFPALDNPDVSIVIPVFNQVEYLEETLASVYEQTYPSWEIVVVDDGSTDPDSIDTLDRLDRPRLHLIRQLNMGLPGARNTGISRARGRFVVPLDADDELDPRFIETMLAHIDEHPTAGFAHCYARLFHDVEALWMTRPFNPYWQLLSNGVLGCVLMRKQAWEEVSGYDESMTDGNEDWEMWVRLTAAGWGQVQVPKVLFNYRKHGISMSVETEARFELGRRQVRDRHPALYATDSLIAMKRRHYPLVTAIADEPGKHSPDIEVIDSAERLRSTWGKYVADTRGLASFPTEALLRLAEALEANPNAGRAVTTSSVPLELARRWNLHDETADPSETVTVNDPTAGSGFSLPAHVERTLWAPPPEVLGSDLPLQRMPPEESGHLPDASSW